MKGRRPKPTALKEAEGNPGKRRLNQLEPVPEGLPRCPRHLSALARTEFRRVVRILGSLKVVTAADQALVAIYAAAWARWVKADEIASATSEVVKTQAGNPILNPHRSVANRAEEIMIKASAELGLTPSSRSRLSVAAPERGKSLRDLLMGGEDDECSMPAKPN